MQYVFSGIVALLLFYVAAVFFVRSSAQRVATVLRYGLPVIVGAVGLGMFFTGRVGLGMGAMGIASALYARARRAGGVQKSPNRRSHVRSAALEMELDLDTGEMNGFVLFGPYEGRELDTMSLDELMELYGSLESDQESVQLMQAYLDRRAAGWRDRADADIGDGLGSAPSPGAMGEQQAYEILGLSAGASEAEIREAHRRLMKRVHPDAGGSVFLAARINQAKDFLLSRHS